MLVLNSCQLCYASHVIRPPSPFLPVMYLASRGSTHYMESFVCAVSCAVRGVLRPWTLKLPKSLEHNMQKQLLLASVRRCGQL